MSGNHKFEVSLTWNPSGKKFTYKEYSRTYTIRSPGKIDVIGTAAPAYMGSEYHYNPEEMLMAALSSCHMLFYLALAANSKIEVLSYHDDVEGELHTEGKLTKFKEVTLRPQIKLAEGADLEKAKALHEKAHHSCFIANSINFPCQVDPVWL